MTGRTVTIELTDEQARIVDELAEGQATTPDRLLLDAIAHGLAMIAAGVDESDLVEPWDRPGASNQPYPDASRFPETDDTPIPF